MPKSRGRILSQKTPTLTLERRIQACEQQAYEFAKGLSEFVKEVNDDLDGLLSQQAECNLRILFMMEHFKVKKVMESPLVSGLTGQRERTEVVQTLREVYLEQREKFQVHLQEQIRAEQAAASADAPALDGSEPVAPLGENDLGPRVDDDPDGQTRPSGKTPIKFPGPAPVH